MSSSPNTPRHSEAVDRLTDALSEDVLNTPGDALLDEVAEDHGDRRALAREFDQILARAANLTAAKQNVADWSRKWVARMLPQASSPRPARAQRFFWGARWATPAMVAGTVLVAMIGGGVYLHRGETDRPNGLVNASTKITMRETSRGTITDRIGSTEELIRQIAEATPVDVTAPDQKPANQTSLDQTLADADAAKYAKTVRTVTVHADQPESQRANKPGAPKTNAAKADATKADATKADAARTNAPNANTPNANSFETNVRTAGATALTAPTVPLATARTAATTVPSQQLAASVPVEQSHVGLASADNTAQSVAPTTSGEASTRAALSFIAPVRGPIVMGFGRTDNGRQNEGIDYAVPEGTDIHAAEDGEVVYAGNDVKGYGNLLLLRHSNGFITGYAHASELLVNRGDAVKRGQVIAKAGHTGNIATPRVHFEIRRGTVPVDPMRYLSPG
jgi:murein DD-endopeptidase MepM/ murein hydrolase activator NlpD